MANPPSPQGEGKKRNSPYHSRGRQERKYLHKSMKGKKDITQLKNRRGRKYLRYSRKRQGKIIPLLKGKQERYSPHYSRESKEESISTSQ